MKLSDQTGYGAVGIMAAILNADMNEILTLIGTILTIVVGLTTVFLNVYKWYKESTKDKKITAEEFKQFRDETTATLETIKNYIK